MVATINPMDKAVVRPSVTAYGRSYVDGGMVILPYPSPRILRAHW